MKNLLTFFAVATFAIANINARPLSASVVSAVSHASETSYKKAFKKPSAPVSLMRNHINPDIAKKYAKSASSAKEMPAGTVLYENFENWTGADKWAPEGWTFNHVKTPTDPNHPGWYVCEPYGDFFTTNAYIYFKFDQPVDEWLISPEFEVAEGMELSADCFNAGIFYFDFEMNGYGWITGKSIRNDFKIMITDNDESSWTKLFSMAESMDDLTSYWDIYDRMGFETVSIPLSQYAGKKVKIAFQVVGEPESNSAGVDNIKVGYPELNLSYSMPSGALYFGLTDTDEYLPGSFMMVPVHRPVTFKNTSENAGAVYSWSYENAEGVQTSDDQKALTVTYTTNHTSEQKSRNNMYSLPTLHGEADFHSATTLEFDRYHSLQAGGKAEFQRHYSDTNEYEWVDLGLSVADPYTEGTRTYADIAVPYFGYNSESDRYWTEYTFNNPYLSSYDPDYRYDPNDPDNWARLEKYANFFYTTDAPIVIEGIRTNAYGHGTKDRNGGFNPETQFTAEIYLLKSNYVIPDKPAYTAVCTLDDMKIIDRISTMGAVNNVLFLNFKFEEPVVISSKDCFAYVVAISGFHDPVNVEYFSPEMSQYDASSGLAYGWVAKKMSVFGTEFPLSWSSVYGHTENTEPEGERLISFYIMLDAVYPWLESETTEISIGDQPVSIAFDSYYDGSELSFENLPSWLEISSTGRFDKTIVTIRAHAPGDAEFTVKAPGVSKLIKVNSTAGIDGIVNDKNDGPVEYFNLQGMRIENPTAGQIVIKRQGSSISKILVQ